MKTFPTLKTLTFAMTALATMSAFGPRAQADDVVVDGKIITAENYDSGAGRAAGGLSKTGPGTLALGSLNSVRSVDGLFLNSRGGDSGNQLLLPAVQKVREAAAKQGDGSVTPADAASANSMKSANNLKQIGLAVHNVAHDGARPMESLSLNFTKVDFNTAGTGSAGGAKTVVVPAASRK